MSKYRVKNIDSTWLLFTPFAFLTMGGNLNHWNLQEKKHWWNKWKTIESFEHKEDAYIAWMKKLDCKISLFREFVHHKNKKRTITCKLNMFHTTNDQYAAGYKYFPYKYFYHICYGSSYEEAIEKLYSDMLLKDLISKKK